MSSEPNITFIIPCYNEEHRLPTMRTILMDFFNSSGFRANMMFVNDGSSDKTEAVLNTIADELRKNFPAQQCDVLSYKGNKGKGWALYTGIGHCKTQWCLTMDADMGSHPDNIIKWLEQKKVNLHDTNTVHIGSRTKGAAEGLNVKASLMRHAAGRTFNFFIQMILGLPIKDTQCGFKLYPTKVASKAFADLIDYGFVHDVEVLVRVYKQGVSVNSLPVSFVSISGSKVSMVKDSIRMFKMLFPIRKKYGRGFVGL